MTTFTEIGYWVYDNELDFLENITELENNPDFEEYGTFNTLENFWEEMEYQGFDWETLVEVTNARYGRCFELVETANNDFILYVGAR